MFKLIQKKLMTFLSYIAPLITILRTYSSQLELREVVSYIEGEKFKKNVAYISMLFIKTKTLFFQSRKRDMAFKRRLGFESS